MVPRLTSSGFGWSQLIGSVTTCSLRPSHFGFGTSASASAMHISISIGHALQHLLRSCTSASASVMHISICFGHAHQHLLRSCTSASASAMHISISIGHALQHLLRSCTSASASVMHISISIDHAHQHQLRLGHQPNRGVGGGSLFLPILNLVAGLQIRTAATFSAFMVTGGSLTTVIYNLFLANSLIDYEITLLSQPCLLLGVSVGVFFNIMFPEWLITVVFRAFLAFSTFKTCTAGVKYWKDETEEIRRRSRDCGDDDVSLEVATAMDGEIVCATVGTPWAKLVILVFVWLSFFSLHVLLGNKDGQSFIHIKPCAVGYWLITLSQIPLAIGFTAYILYAKHRLNNENSHENKLIKSIVGQNGIGTQSKFLFPVAALLSGIVGGLLGIGGGLLINPVLLQIGVPPQRTAATTCFMVLFSSSMSSAQYLILGLKGVKQALVYAQLCMVGSALGLIMMQRVVIKSGRASLIVFMVSIVMALSAISITSFGAIDVWRDYTTGKNMGFKLPC